MAINPQLFAQAGEALFGPEWKQPMADLLGMNVRTVRRIAKACRDGDDYPVNATVGPVLARHLRQAVATYRDRAAEAERLAKLFGG